MAIILLIGERILKSKSMVNMMNEGVKTTRLTGEESTEVEGLDLRRLTGRKSSVTEFFQRYEGYFRNGSSVDRHPDIARLQAWHSFFVKNGVRHLASITPGLVDTFRMEELEGRKPKTIKNYISLLKTALNKAVEWDLIDQNPIANVSVPKTVKTFNFFSKEEIAQLLKIADSDVRTGIQILVSTGMRRGELFHLRCRDVDLKNGSIRVWPYGEYSPKGKRPRTIPMTGELKKIFSKLVKDKKLDDYAFRPFVSENRLYKRFAELLKELEMRHTPRSPPHLRITPGHGRCPNSRDQGVARSLEHFYNDDVCALVAGSTQGGSR